MLAKCIKRLTVPISFHGISESFDDSKFYEFIRSLNGGTVVVFTDNRKVKIESQTFDSHFISIDEMRDDKLNKLLT